MKRIYLDQNVLGGISAQRLRLPDDGHITWLYSDEHIKEVARGQSTEILDVLVNLRAQRLVVKRDAANLITDEWSILDYEDPHSVYSEFTKSGRGRVGQSGHFTGLIAAVFGAQDPSLRDSYPDAVASQIEDSLMASGLLTNRQVEQIVEPIRKLSADAIGEMGQPVSLEDRRKPLVLNKGRASAFEQSENPIAAIWAYLEKDAPSGMTANQFFGIDPVEKTLFGYAKWPQFLAVVMCYLVLGTIGFAPDKGMPKPKRVPANLSDACHVAYASFADAIYSADAKLCKKARAIYRYKRLAVEVHELNS